MKLGAVTLAAGAAADYELSEGKLTLHPATGAAALKTAGAWSITVTAAGYSDSTVNQSVLNGAAASIAVTVQPVPGSFDGGLFATQPAVTLKDQYGNTVAAGAGSNANVTASIKTGDTWSLGGTLTKAAVSGVAAFSDLTHSVRQAGAKMTFACDGKTADSNSFDIIIPVADLAAIAGNGQAAFTFSASPGAASVRLHKSSASAAAGFADTGVSLDAASTSALVTGLTNDTQYWFKLVVTGGLYAGGSNVATATPGVVAATVITASTAGGDGKVNIAEKAAGFNVVAQSTASAGKLYLVPDGVYADEAALDAAKIVSAPITAANTNVTLSVAPAAALADAATYKVYAVDGTHYLSSGVDAFITDFTAPALSSAQKATSNSNASYAKAGNTVTYTLNMSEAVTAVINTGAAMSNATGAITDLATESSSSKTIDGTVANGDNGAVALTAGGYTFADAAGNTSLVAYTDINTAAANVITADTTVPTAVIPSVSSGSNNSTALVITFFRSAFCRRNRSNRFAKC